MSFARKIFILSVALGSAVLFFVFMRNKFQSIPLKPGLKKAFIGKNLVWVKIAQTPQEREQGLSGISSMNEDEGMLFIFPQKGIYKFWMKEMNFALDFIWIADGKVVDLTENVPPPQLGTSDSQIARCQSSRPADMVLEVNAGWIKKQQVKIGGQFYLKN